MGKAAASAEHADSKVQHLHNSVEGLHGKFGELARVAGEFGLALGGVEIIKKSFEAVKEYNTGLGQLQAGLVSTKGVAGVTMEAMGEQAEKLESTSLFGVTDIMNNLQAQLLTFPKVTKDVFERSSSDIVDMATRLHKPLQETTIMVGKALQDPIRGLTMLNRVGINFTEDQKAVIKSLVNTGHAAQAQGIILKELETEFGGSSAAARKADPFAAMKNDMEKIFIIIGRKLLPVFDKMNEAFRNAFEWAKSHKEVIYNLAEGAAILATAIGLVTAAEWALNLAASPLGLLAAGITAITFALQAMGLSWVDVAEGCVYFGIVVKQSFIGLFEFITNGFAGIAEGAKGVGLALIGDFSGANKAFAGAGNSFAKAGTGWTNNTNGLTDYAASEAERITGKGKKSGAHEANGLGIGGGAESGGLGSGINSLEGHRPQNLTINITDLVKNLTIQTTNLKEGAGQVKEMVTRMLLEAVNDVNIAHGQ